MNKILPAFLFFAIVVAVLAWDGRRGRDEPWPQTPAYGQTMPIPAETQMETLRALGLELTPEAEAAVSTEYPYETVLLTLGLGDYDYEAGSWTPTSAQVFYMDGEVLDIEGMYGLLFQGLQSISQDELTFSDVRADFTGVDWEKDTGTVPVTFRVNGVEAGFEAQWQGDWIDFGILDTVNDCLTGERRFYYTYGGQGEILFYCDAAWAQEFTARTGLRLTDRQGEGMMLW